MLRYETIGSSVIEVDMHNDYGIVAIAKWNNTDKNYSVTYLIKSYDTLMYDTIETGLIFDSDMKTINKDMFMDIITRYNIGDFDSNIDSFEYTIKCFDYGNDYYETEGDLMEVI